MNILVTGAAGYKGSVLIPKLLGCGYHVKALDTMWFGNYLPLNKNLTILEKDIRETTVEDVTNVSKVIHLASVANDPCGDLNPELTWEISALATMKLIEACLAAGVQQFIYASSGSVYGIKTEEEVTEELPLVPISGYNKTKMIAERVLLSYRDRISIQIIRPATVCGLSPRMRLDVSVNMLTMQALNKGTITVLGGSQTRPNIHIEDITDIYLFFLNNPQHVGIFNAGFENLSILDIAETIKEKTGASIEVKPSNDPRSYRVNSDKLLKTGFTPRRNVSDAIEEISAAFKAGKLKDDDNKYNLKWMKQHDFA